MNFLSKIAIGLGVVILIGFFSAIVYRVAFLTFVDNYEFAYSFNGLTGKTEPLLNPDGTFKHGYVKCTPFIYVVHTIDCRPIQICISANSVGASTRVLNCKLVEFDPKGYKQFIQWHGRQDYTNTQLEDLLKNYAYDESGQVYPFVKITKELKNQNVSDVKIDTTSN